MIKHTVLAAKQFQHNHIEAPLIPPNKFLHVDRRTPVFPETSDDARHLYQTYSKHSLNRNIKMKFVDGALYTSLFNDCVEILHPKPGCMISINVCLLDSGEISQVVITYDIHVGCKYLMSLNKLGIYMSKMKGNTFRSSLKDDGKMSVIGCGKKGNGSVGTYKLTNESEDIHSATTDITDLAGQYNNNIGSRQVMDDISSNSSYGFFQTNKFFASSIVPSEDLVNAGHCDVNDSSKCIATWTELKIWHASCWYFIMTNVTLDGVRGLAVALHHGVSIKWDGRKNFHCSSVGHLGVDNHVYGSFFGSK